MPLPTLSGAYRTITKFANIAAGNPFTCTMDWLEATQTVDVKAELAQEVEDLWEGMLTEAVGAGDIGDYISDSVQLLSTTVYELDGTSAPLVDTSANFIGQSTLFDPLPPETAMVVSKRTDFRGRSGRGRFYMGGWTANAMDDDRSGNFDGTLRDSMQSYWGGNARTLTDGTYTWNMVVITPQTPPASGPWVPTARQVTSIVVDTATDTQRRRGTR